MNHRPLARMTEEQLVDRFADIALAQDEALLDDENAKYNRLYDKMEDVRQELKLRPGDQRRAILPLLQHENAQVRLKAALTTLAIAPEAARHALQIISDRHEYPQAIDARGMLRALESGTYIPS